MAERCRTCGGRGWHTAGGNDPMPCNCPAGEAFERGSYRIVSVTRGADRHADLHDREFAETRSATVQDGDLRTVVDAALAEVGFEHGARFLIEVEEPHDAS